MNKKLKPFEGVEQFKHKGKCLLCKKSVIVHAVIQGALYQSTYECECGFYSIGNIMLDEKRKRK